MKRTLALAIVLFVLGGSLAAQQQTDLQKDDLHGDVKSVTETDYDAKEWFGEWVKGALKNKTFRAYDAKGNRTEYRYYDATELVRSIVYTYTNGNVSEAVYYKEDGVFEYKDQYIYDEKGNLIEVSCSYADGSLRSKYMYTYDENGNRTEDSFFIGDGSINSKHLYSYDAQGNRVEELIYHSEGILKYRSLCTYDDEGNLIEVVTYDGEGELHSKALYSYDDKGNKTEQNNFSLYFNDDWLIKSKYFNVYEYDMNNNWLKRTWSSEVTKFGKTYPEPQSITIREITYF